MSVIAVLGSAFAESKLGDRDLEPVNVSTEFGDTVFHKWPRADGQPAYALFRHGAPRKFLPNQIPYLANAAAMRQLGCQALLLTSAVSVLEPQVPLNVPLTVIDALMADNRLPSGRPCTLFQEPYERQGSLTLEEGLFSIELSEQMEKIADGLQIVPQGRVVLAYHVGPRGRTRTENGFWHHAGAHVSSMTVAPEAVLANEVGIPVASVVVGYRYTLADAAAEHAAAASSLEMCAPMLERAAMGFLEYAVPVSFPNRLYAL